MIACSQSVQLNNASKDYIGWFWKSCWPFSRGASLRKSATCDEASVKLGEKKKKKRAAQNESGQSGSADSLKKYLLRSEFVRHIVGQVTSEMSKTTIFYVQTRTAWVGRQLTTEVVASSCHLECGEEGTTCKAYTTYQALFDVQSNC